MKYSCDIKKRKLDGDKSELSTKRSIEQLQLKKSIEVLVEQDQNGTFKTTITCGLANYISENMCLRQILDAVSDYSFERDKDHPRLFSGGFFEFRDKQIFFKCRPGKRADSGAILIGLLYEIDLIPKFAEYQYYSIEAIKGF